MPGIELLATVTNVAKQRHAAGLITAKSFAIKYFEIGSQGHDPADPLIATNPDPSDTELAGKVFGPEAIDGSGYLTPDCPYFECTLELSEAVGSPVSSIALVAEIVDDGYDPVSEIGVTFLYAIAHHPLQTKTGSAEFNYTIGIQI